jgi:hypothetical protein
MGWQQYEKASINVGDVQLLFAFGTWVQVKGRE